MNSPSIDHWEVETYNLLGALATLGYLVGRICMEDLVGFVLVLEADGVPVLHFLDFTVQLRHYLGLYQVP